MNHLSRLLLVMLSLVLFGTQACHGKVPTAGEEPDGWAFSDYFLSLTFRESPYAPHRGIHRISAQRAMEINHYRFDYDENGQLAQISFGLGDHPRRPNHTANYFWYAATEQYEYEGGKETVRYLDKWGNPTSVHGDVVHSEYMLDPHGRRIGLRYLGDHGEAVNSRWGIHRYTWRHLDDGSVIETRFDLEGNPMPLRPGFAFETIRISYDVNGFTRLMQSVDAQGRVVDSGAGFAQDRFTHSRHGELLRYEVLDEAGAPTTNHQGISSGLLSFTPQGHEHISRYLDIDGNPVPNNHGWWQSERGYDRFGNLTLNAFQALDGAPMTNPETGYANARIEYHADGLRRRSFRYFDHNGDPTNHHTRGYHEVRYGYDPAGQPLEIALTDTDGRLVERPDQGWAVTRFQPSQSGQAPTAQRYTLQQLRQEQADEALRILQEMSGAPGMAAAIAVNGDVVWHHEAGMADIGQQRKVDAQTVFRLASVSKAVTSVVVAAALERGDLGLDDSATDWLEVDHQASLAQLLSHTGSVSHYRPTVFVDLDRPYPSSQSALPTVLPHLMDDPPGQRYVYSTFGYTLAAAMVESATGATFPELLDALVGTAQTPSMSAPVEEGEIDALTRFYEISPGGIESARPRNFSYAFAGAGVVSNASDLARFMSLFASAELVDENWRDVMLQPATFVDGTVIHDKRWDVALGWRQQQGPLGNTWYHHAGVTDGARTVVAIEPSSGVAVAILSNASWTGDMFGTAATLAELFLPGLSPDNSFLSGAIFFEDEEYQLGLEGCEAVTCTFAGPSSGELYDWLSGSGRDGQFKVRSTAEARYLASPYGLALFHGGEAEIGSRRVTLENLSGRDY